MKRILLLLFLIVTTVIIPFAQNSKENSNSKPIRLEARGNETKSTVHRAPMYINIKAYYDAETNKISIIYDGEKSGEVFLYLNGNVIDYDSELNTSFQISECGLYKIEIISDSWIAEGFLRL